VRTWVYLTLTFAGIEQKKIIISQVISQIEIGKGYKINIKLNMGYEQFCAGWNGLKAVDIDDVFSLTEAVIDDIIIKIAVLLFYGIITVLM